MSPKGPPFNFFDILQHNGRSKNPRGSYFGTMRLTGDLKNFRKKSVIFFYYFDIVRLLLDKKFSAKILPSFFLDFCGRMDVEKYQKVPLSVFFRNCETFQFFSPKGPHFNFLMICNRRDERCQSVSLVRQSGPTFGVLEKRLL